MISRCLSYGVYWVEKTVVFCCSEYLRGVEQGGQLLAQ